MGPVISMTAAAWTRAARRALIRSCAASLPQKARRSIQHSYRGAEAQFPTSRWRSISFLKEIGSGFMQFIPIVERIADDSAPDGLTLIPPDSIAPARISRSGLSSPSSMESFFARSSMSGCGTMSEKSSCSFSMWRSPLGLGWILICAFSNAPAARPR